VAESVRLAVSVAVLAVATVATSARLAVSVAATGALSAPDSVRLAESVAELAEATVALSASVAESAPVGVVDPEPTDALSTSPPVSLVEAAALTTLWP
jgi:hypothetical protein